jgi:hypothetical protein
MTWPAKYSQTGLISVTSRGIEISKESSLCIQLGDTSRKMKNHPKTVRASVLLLALCSFLHPWAAEKAPVERPGLLFREDWKESPAALPITQTHIVNTNLILTLYGPGKTAIKKSHHDQPADDPYYIWSGECAGNWALSLRPKASWVDLTGQAKIRWRTMQSGFRQLRIVLKLANRTWLVSDQAEGASSDWQVREFTLADIRWRRLNIETVIEGNWVDRPDLSKVEEVGFTDLMAGGGSAACSRLDWIEVYGRPVLER